MSNPLTAGQQALLESALLQRQLLLDVRLREHHLGLTRAEHAHDVLEQDGDDAPQRQEGRSVDMALSDMQVRELGDISRALQRLRAGTYGRCVDCQADIAFDRLRVEPWAERCLACASVREQDPRAA